mgnify:CR=1 FL=1
MGLHTRDIARQFGDDKNAQAAQQVADIKIMQKVNSAHREAFREKFPNQVEHCLRLVMERLQAGLDKRDGVDAGRVDTWKLTPGELADLSEAARHLNEIRRGF